LLDEGSATVTISKGDEKMKKKLSVMLVLTTLALTISAGSVHAGTGYTYTRYPIVLVGGILDYDNLLIMDYYYGVDWALQKDAWTGSWWSKRQPVTYIMLSPLQNTRARGLDLAMQVQDLMAELGVEKVNIIAHSHGSTTSRFAMNYLANEAQELGKPNPIASLTTIAGPHYGTASADASTLPFWPEPLLEFVYKALNFAGDVLATLTSISYDTFFQPESPSAHPQDYIGDQQMAEVARDFTQDGIQQFNADFPCAGIPRGGSYGRMNNMLPKYGSDGTPGAFAGDGLGNALSVNDPDATLYYSWTGDVSHPVTNEDDLLDISMFATWLLSELYCNFGHITKAEEITVANATDFFFAIIDAIDCVTTDGCQPTNTIATDAFIPVSSAKFGDFISVYPWNHIDEQNQTWGLLGPDAPEPIEVFRTHANRLYCANR
jgi:triacylglycerol lipase